MPARRRKGLEYHANGADGDAASLGRGLPAEMTGMAGERLEQMRKMDDGAKHMGLS